MFTTKRLTVYWIDPSGSSRVPPTVLGDHIDGSAVTDGAPRLQLVAHADDQRCLAHPLREARDLLALHPEEDEIATMMVPLRDHLSWMIGLYDRRDTLAPSTWLQYRARARRELIALAERPWKHPDCVRMAKRIRREVDLWVTFLWDTTGEMEPTDNRSERALRPAVIDRRRVQQNRSLGGLYRDMVLRSVAYTCRQLGVSMVTVASEALLSRTRDGPATAPSPTLLAAFQAARARSGSGRTPTPTVINARV